MELITKTLLALHLGAGILSILMFWIPALNRKGGVNHRKIGKWYVRLMWVVVLSAALLCVKNVIIGAYVPAAFLGFLSLITANPLWYGIAILNHKKETGNSIQFKQMLFHLVIVFFAIFLIGYGLVLKGSGTAILMFIFGGLGLMDIPKVLVFFRKKEGKVDWLKAHIVGMGSSGIAAYTAFFVFGGRAIFENILTGYMAIIPWVAPTVIGTFLINYAVKRYRPKHQVA